MAQSPLVTSPAEVRNTIYELALTETEPIELTKRGLHKLQPPLTRVCRQVRSECSSLIFANDFTTTVADCDITLLTRFVASLSPAQASLIKSLRITCTGQGSLGVLHKIPRAHDQVLPEVWQGIIDLLLSKGLDAYRVHFSRDPAEDYLTEARVAANRREVAATSAALDNYVRRCSFDMALFKNLVKSMHTPVDRDRLLITKTLALEL